MSDRECDFVIVGGGVYGAALAYELAQRGSSVTLVEAGQLAGRASGGPGKRGVRANGRNSRELILAREALEIWPGLADELGNETGFERLGGLMLFASMPNVGEIGRAKAEAHRRLQLTYGVETQLLEREDLDSVEPGLGPAEAGALYCPDEGIASQSSTARAYAAAAEKCGASVWEAASVVHIGVNPRPFARLEDGRVLEPGRTVVLAANYGTNSILERSLLPQLPLWIMAPQVLMFLAKNSYQPRHLIGHLQKPLAVKPLLDGVTMISGGMRGKWDPEAARGEPVEDMIRTSLRVAAEVLPALEDGELLSADAGAPETFTPDGLPFVDFLDSEQRIFVAAGWHGHGFAIAPSMCRYIADWLTTGQKSDLLAPFAIQRDEGGGPTSARS